jgi:hypothetical protein
MFPDRDDSKRSGARAWPNFLEGKHPSRRLVPTDPVALRFRLIRRSIDAHELSGLRLLPDKKLVQTKRRFFSRYAAARFGIVG